MLAQHQVNQELAGHVHMWKHWTLGHHTWDWQLEVLGVLRLFKYFLSAWPWARKLFLFLAYKMKETLKNHACYTFFFCIVCMVNYSLQRGSSVIAKFIFTNQDFMWTSITGNSTKRNSSINNVIKIGSLKSLFGEFVAIVSYSCITTIHQ